MALPLVVTIIFVMTKLALAVESQSMKVFKDSSGLGNYHQSKGAPRYVGKKNKNPLIPHIFSDIVYSAEELDFR